jgi:hypothetical protein
VDLEKACKDIVDQLTAAGVRAAIDARDLNPPCVQVRRPTLHYQFGRSIATADWELWLLVPDSGTSQALKAASELLTAVQTAIGFAGVEATPDDAALPDGSTVPMYRLTWSKRIKE